MMRQTEPRFHVGDAVWAPNSEPRVITGMRWGRSMKRENEPESDPVFWGWILSTVHPDDPGCVGQGFEAFYRLRDTQ